MTGSARGRHMTEFASATYPAFSRRARQVCILSSALEKIASGEQDARTVARMALEQADAFDWNARAAAAPQPAEAKTAAVDGMTAWRDYAQHLEWCATCAQDSVGSCHEGTALKEATAIATQEGGHD